MHIEIEENGLLIVPDTKFETQYISRTFHVKDGEIQAFVKSGLTLADVIGLKITVPPQDKKYDGKSRDN